MKITLATLSTQRIVSLRREACEAGDDRMVLTCDIALGNADGDVAVACRDICDALNYTEAQS